MSPLIYQVLPQKHAAIEKISTMNVVLSMISANANNVKVTILYFHPATINANAQTPLIIVLLMIYFIAFANNAKLDTCYSTNIYVAIKSPIVRINLNVNNVYNVLKAF